MIAQKFFWIFANQLPICRAKFRDLFPRRRSILSYRQWRGLNLMQRHRSRLVNARHARHQLSCEAALEQRASLTPH